jgi:acyl carrier protein
MNSAPTQEQILNDLRPILRTFNGREYDGEITMQTKFFEDLGIASIEALILGEQVEKFYGRDIPFHRMIAEKANEKLIDLEVGDLVEFLHRVLQEPPGESEEDISGSDWRSQLLAQENPSS